MASIEIISSNKVRIGVQLYRLFTYEHPLPDGSILGVEAFGRPYGDCQDKFSLISLSGVLASDIPSGFSFSVYEPYLETRQIDNIYFKNIADQLIFGFSVHHYYKNWHHKTNLMHYCDDLAASMSSVLPLCLVCNAEQDEYGVWNWCRVEIPKDSDLYKYVRDIERIVQVVLRDSIRSERLESGKAAKQSLKPDETGFKWWLRYIVIPLFGSAVIVALIKWFLA